METFLNIISFENFRPQTKLKIFAKYIPSQFIFQLRLYNLSSTWIAENLDALCVRYVRRWVEAPVSSCIKQWLISPSKYCGLGIPSFQSRAENLKIGKRYALKNSPNENIRELWSDSIKDNITSDSLLQQFSLKQAINCNKEAQTKAASDHFLTLGSQGKIAKAVSEYIPSKQITNWSKIVDLLPGHVYNFVRKAVQSQLPTFDNLHRWGRAPSNLCPMCGFIQTNKHVLSNCSSNGALSRYTIGHNKALKILIH